MRNLPSCLCGTALEKSMQSSDEAFPLLSVNRRAKSSPPVSRQGPPRSTRADGTLCRAGSHSPSTALALTPEGAAGAESPTELCAQETGCRHQGAFPSTATRVVTRRLPGTASPLPWSLKVIDVPTVTLFNSRMAHEAGNDLMLFFCS